MKTRLLLLITLFSTLSYAQTFDWESVSFNGTNYVRQTVAGIQAECTNSSNTVLVINGLGFAGSSGNVITSSGNVTSMSVTFSVPINIQSIFALDGNGQPGTWTFSPTGGTNPNIVQNIVASIGSTVNVNWTGITSFTITSSSIARFALDDIVFTPIAAACSVNIPDVNFKNYLVANTAINTNNDTEIQCSEAAAYTGAISVSNLNIQDLTGIEAFTEITSLEAYGNTSLTSIDVSQNTKITQLLIEQTGVSGILDLSMLTVLVDFKGHTTAIAAINMANGNNSNVTRFNVVNSAVDCVQIDANFTPNSNWDIPPSGSFNTDCPTILSVDEFKFNTVSLYPNPATSVLNIEMPQNLKQATIYNIVGTKVLQSTSKILNTANLKSGMYLISIEDETGNVATKRFIKQ
jgi:hypothetical protein